MKPVRYLPHFRTRVVLVFAPEFELSPVIVLLRTKRLWLNGCGGVSFINRPPSALSAKIFEGIYRERSLHAI